MEYYAATETDMSRELRYLGKCVLVWVPTQAGPRHGWSSWVGDRRGLGGEKRAHRSGELGPIGDPGETERRLRMLPWKRQAAGASIQHLIYVLEDYSGGTNSPVL